MTLEDATITVDEDSAHAKQKIGDVMRTLNRTMSDIRAYILDLRSPASPDNWQTRLGEMVRNFRLQTLVNAELVASGKPTAKMQNASCDEILAIAREALTNVAKHAQATRVDVQLTYRSHEIALDITDNGCGFSRNGDAPSTSAEHQGLRNMQERTRLIGGHLDLDSTPGRGTTIRLVVPCSENE